MIRMNPNALCRNVRFQGNRCISVEPNGFLWGSVHFHENVDSCRNDEKEKLGTCSSEVECVSSTTANLGGHGHQKWNTLSQSKIYTTTIK